MVHDSMSSPHTLPTNERMCTWWYGWRCSLQLFMWGTSPSLNEGTVNKTALSEVQTASGLEDLVPPVVLADLGPAQYYYRIVVTTTGTAGEALTATTLYGGIEPSLIQDVTVSAQTDAATSVDNEAGTSTLNGHVILPEDVTFRYVSRGGC